MELLDQVTAWAHERLPRHGITITGPLTAQRSRPWSTHFTIPSDAGVLWLKAVPPSGRFEPLLQEALGSLVPGVVQPPIESDRERGWMVTADQGPTLANGREPTLDDWLCTVLAATTMQQQLMSHRDALLATGLPDCRPETVPARFDRLTELLADLPAGHPSHLPSDELGFARSVRARVDAAAALLRDSSLGSTWQHGDLHPHNVFAHGDRTRVFDLGSSQRAHALEMLVVPYSILMDAVPAWWGPVREASRDAWGVSVEEFEAMWSAVLVTQAINHAATWFTVVESASGQDLLDWGDRARHHLLRWCHE